MIQLFVTIKWIKVDDLWGGQNYVNENIRFETLLLKSDLCDYSDVYIVVKRRVTIEGNALSNRANKKVVFKNKALFRSCKSKIKIRRQFKLFLDNE